MRALLVDDERLARVRLRRLLGAHAEITQMYEADSVQAAVEVIAQHPPDVIFLDVQMPGGSGFTLFEAIEVSAPVVFVTAYDQHALRAFAVNALDYLLKPVEPARLAQSLARLGAPRVASGPLRATDHVVLDAERGQRLIALARVTHLTGADDYTQVHLNDGRDHLSRLRLSAWADRLADAGFFRVHRTTIVNGRHVLGWARDAIELNGVADPQRISRGRRAATHAWLATLPRSR